MLGWVIKRGLNGGRDAPDEDDTQIEQPDTPGPVFAARAFKSALFGTPARPDNTDRIQPVDDETIFNKKPDATSALKDGKKDGKNVGKNDGKATPGRLPGILLTPGTATSRRKRVSFGQNVEHSDNTTKRTGLDANVNLDTAERTANLFGSNRPRSASTAPLESSRNATARPADEDAWEEVDDNEDDMDGDPDVTVDLNEPHSQSGRYWKSQFQRYQEDAKVEMSKLLKYKQLAKSYAKMKDTEASDIQNKLREEKDKVADMESRISALATQISRTRMQGSDRDHQKHLAELARQTALAAQYRNQVRELEAMLHGNSTDTDDVFRQGGQMSTISTTSTGSPVRRRPSSFAVPASPNTHKTLAETRRELRRAREQAQELTRVKEEVRRLKTSLHASESKTKALSADLASANAAVEEARAKVEDLEKRAQFAEEEIRLKDRDNRVLQRKYDCLKEETKRRVTEAEQVVVRKNKQIHHLKEQVRQNPSKSSIAAMATMGAAGDDEDLITFGDKDATSAEAKTSTKTSTKTSSTTPTNLEEMPRHRYESLSNKRSQEAKKAPLDAKSTSRGLGGLVINADDLDFDLHEPELPQLPQQKFQRPLGKRRAKKDHDAVSDILIHQDDTSQFELPPIKNLSLKDKPASTARPSLAARARLAEKDAKAAADDDENADLDAIANANLIVRRRHAAEPLRAREKRKAGALGRIDMNSNTATAPDNNDQVTGLKRKTPAAAGHSDDAAAAAAVADASSQSMTSARTAAAVERINKRRQQRALELGLQPNKENMQPA